jgi:hypothetical protein
MTRHRFDEIFKHWRTGHQPAICPETVSSEKYHWLLTDNFVMCLNDHRDLFFTPSHLVCVDESISWWYGQGGLWINPGLPLYVAIRTKLDYGCELQDSCCGVSGILMRLMIVKSAKEESTSVQEVAPGLLHGTAVMIGLVSPWQHTNRIFCADSYFASVPAASELLDIGLKFIGVVKSATRGYPMDYLSQIEFAGQGNWEGIHHRDVSGYVNMMAYCWVDRERRYFISTTGTLNQGAPYNRLRWRQLDPAVNA